MGVRPRTYLWVALLHPARQCSARSGPARPARTTSAGIAFLIAGLVVSGVFGLLRGRTMPMSRDASGRLHRKGGRVTPLLRLATLAARPGLGTVAEAAFGEPFNTNALWLGAGIRLGVRQPVTSRHGRRPPLPDLVQDGTSPGGRSTASSPRCEPGAAPAGRT